MSRIKNFLLEREDMLEYQFQSYYQELKERYQGPEDEFLLFFQELMEGK
jgi:hypothetical protein